MKAIKRLLSPVIMFALAAGISTLPATTAKSEPAPPPVGVSFQFFYDNLSPYGTWVSYPSHGYVWIPRAGAGFRPYFSSGHWVYTPEGWMWVSLYDWGWAPFHYGSWLYDPFYGWLWVPGYHWAPAWVTWGYYSGYYGWAPLAPGISFSFSYYPPIDYWVFVPPRYVTVSGWNNTYYTAYNNRIAFDNNTAISNVKSIDVVKNAGTYGGQRFSAGPPKADFERVANTKVSTASVRDNNTPSKTKLSGNNVTVYRPRVDASDRSTARPAKVAPLEKMKRSGGDRTGDENKVRSRETEKKAPEIQRERAPQRTAPEIRKEKAPEKAAPVRKEQPRQERKQDIDRSTAPKKENVQPQRKEQPPEARPKQDVEPPKKAEPREQHRERPKQAPAERMERTQPQPKAAPERRQQMERAPKEPRHQPQPQPRDKGGRNPK